ncbi:MAG TPA: DDE-type integrase/transposase/recombinase [Acidobacteriaceae bacterium]|nr:DDE-type integrase/transposase/recombinase [Acidobacteriaceae bacterium]
MAWRASRVADQRKKFVTQYESGHWAMAELCRMYDISRQSGYKWVKRGQQGEVEWEDRSRAAHHHPLQMAAEIEEKILACRYQHPTWGARKLRKFLSDRDQKARWPALSTIGELLKRSGLSNPSRKRRPTPPYTEPFQQITEANQVWCADFKGWFRTGNGERVDPLTITDAASRYLLRCQITEKTDTPHVLAVFETAFREYGLPVALRTDNGPPFASRAIAGLSALAVYWMKLGIIPERIAAGRPDQNGRHERMHRTLKAETAKPAAATARAQQKSFDRFRAQYNQDRPHEALQMETPASRYGPSPRSYPARVPEPEYPADMLVRKVGPCGTFKWKGEKIFLSEVLPNEAIGLERIEEDLWRIHFATFPIGLFDSRRACTYPLAKKEHSSGQQQRK